MALILTYAYKLWINYVMKLLFIMKLMFDGNKPLVPDQSKDIVSSFKYLALSLPMRHMYVIDYLIYMG